MRPEDNQVWLFTEEFMQQKLYLYLIGVQFGPRDKKPTN